MRGSQFVWLSIMALALLGVAASGVSAAESGCLCFDSAFRASGGIADSPVTSGDLKLEGAIGLPEFSLAVWADIAVIPSITSTFGGEIKLTRDWLSLSVNVQQTEFLVDLSLQASAAPSAWLLVDGTATLLGGVTTTVETGLLGGSEGNSISVSPYLAGVIPVGDTVVTPTFGLDVRLAPETQALEVSGSRITSTVNAGVVLIANTVHFSGLFGAFSSLVVSISMPNCGLIVSGSVIPTGTGSFTYRASVSYEWGDAYLLPVQADTGSACTGDVCY